MSDLGLFVIPIKVDNSISTYNDYIDFLVEAERYGYTHAYIGEHLTDKKEDIQSSLIFASAVLARTKKMNLCLCVLPLPHYEINLLIKQLEDLYLLSKGRLQIGFSQGALKSDAEYLNFNHNERSKIFSEKLENFMIKVNNSEILKEIPLNNFFSTLLSPFPTKASNLFDSGYSAITSNFVNEAFWDNHIGCFTKNQYSTNSSSKWHLTMNLIPKESISLKTKTSIKLSLNYIYEKLNLCNLDVMIPFQKNIAKNSEEEVLEILYKRMTYSQIPEKYFELKKKYSTRIGHPIINLFDCISEIDYTKYIFDFPKNGNF